MRAVVIREGELVVEARDTPIPGRGEVRVRVHATAVNRADILQVRGGYPAPPGAVPDVPGLEYAGVVDAVGPAVDPRRVGERVYGIVGGGSYAEHLLVDADTTSPIPAGLSFHEAAAVPEAFLTAYDAMVVQAGLAAGETALVHAVGSGVGTAAVQIARAIGARSIGTARSRHKLDAAAALGMTHGVVAEGGAFAAEVRRLTDGRGVDVVLDLVGGPYCAESIACAAPRARLMLVGLLGGPRGELDLGAILRGRLTIRGTVLRSRPLDEKIACARVLTRLGPLFASGALRPVVDAVLPLEAAAEAHARVAASDAFGKLVLDCA